MVTVLLIAPDLGLRLRQGRLNPGLGGLIWPSCIVDYSPL